jgi:nucleotide-binding universal stress UspA family protein
MEPTFPDARHRRVTVPLTNGDGLVTVNTHDAHSGRRWDGHEAKGTTMNDIIVGIDRSKTAATALAKATALAEAQRANLHIVMCVDRSKPIEINIGTDRFHSDFLSDASEFIDEAARRTGGSTTTAVGMGDPAEFLCEEARRLEARTIVVGNRRAQTMARVLGTVAADVVKQAPCDVLVANTCVGSE